MSSDNPSTTPLVLSPFDGRNWFIWKARTHASMEERNFLRVVETPIGQTIEEVKSLLLVKGNNDEEEVEMYVKVIEHHKLLKNEMNVVMNCHLNQC